MSVLNHPYVIHLSRSGNAMLCKLSIDEVAGCNLWFFFILDWLKDVGYVLLMSYYFRGDLNLYANGKYVLRITIRMYFSPGEHNPPHFHAYYNEYRASFSIDSFEISNGEFPRKQTRLVQAWAELHVDELKANWKLAMNAATPGQSLFIS